MPQPNPDTHLHPHARWNLAFAYISLFYYGLCDNIRGPLYPEMIQTFGLSNAQGTWFFALGSLVTVVGGGLISWGLRRWGYLRMFRWNTFILALAQFLYALSPSFKFLLLGSFVMGIGMSVLGVMQNVLVMVGAPPAKMSRWMSGLHANYGAASLFAPLLVAGLAQWTPHFQASFWVTGTVGLFILASSFLIPGFVEPVPHDGTKTLRQSLSAEILYMAAYVSCYVLAEVLVSTRLAQFVRLRSGADLAEGGYWTSLFFIGLFAGRLLFSFLRLPFSLRSQLIVAFGLTTVFSILGIWTSPWAFLGVGFLMGPCYPMSMAFFRELFPHRLEQVTTACIVGSGLFIVVMHLSTGPITDLFGIRWAMALGPVFSLLALLMLLAAPLFWPTGPGRKDERSWS